jgi:hypothetical protein
MLEDQILVLKRFGVDVKGKLKEWLNIVYCFYFKYILS